MFRTNSAKRQGVDGVKSPLRFISHVAVKRLEKCIVVFFVQENNFRSMRYGEKNDNVSVENFDLTIKFAILIMQFSF